MRFMYILFLCGGLFTFSSSFTSNNTSRKETIEKNDDSLHFIRRIKLSGKLIHQTESKRKYKYDLGHMPGVHFFIPDSIFKNLKSKQLSSYYISNGAKIFCASWSDFEIMKAKSANSNDFVSNTNSSEAYNLSKVKISKIETSYKIKQDKFEVFNMSGEFTIVKVDIAFLRKCLILPENIGLPNSGYIFILTADDYTIK